MTKDASRELLLRVIRLIAERFGELPEDRPGEDRRVFHAQLAMTLLDELASGDPAKIIELVQSLLRLPSTLIPME